ncbi:hypothetical protein L9G16_03345 [Shewanella sp. A25]|nr:hypothetical protein [Shewanella shenzhenensis]
MKRLSGYPNWFFWMIILCVVVTTLTGLFMFPWVMEFKLQWDIDLGLSGDLRLPAVVMHVLLGWLMLMLLGALWHSHIRAGWRKKLNYVSGLVTSFSLLLLACSGIGLYYFSSETAQLLASLLHTFLGLLLFSGFIWHYIGGRNIQKQNSKRQRILD